MASLLSDIEVAIFDIEGTTTPVTFVKDKLFPYARAHVRGYLERTFDTEETQNDINCLRKQVEDDIAAGLEAPLVAGVEEHNKEIIVESVVRNVLWQMDRDRKTTGLKQLQGRIWRNAYAAGEIQGEVYDDVPCSLRRLIANGIRLYTYSSGSVGAQRLLFGHSTHGNLLDLFVDQYDTAVGAKVVKESYTRISEAIRVPPARILFFTDIPQEAEAADLAGFKVCLVVREGNAPLEKTYPFPLVHSFDELFHD